MNGAPAYVQSGAFLLLALAAVWFHLMPLQMEARSPVLPDLLLALAAAWVLRRPDTLPLLLAAGTFLLADLVLDRPTGLWAMLSLMIVEFLRGQRPVLRDRPFPVEWGTVAVLVAIALLLQALILTVALVPLPDAGRVLRFYVVTLAAYPFVVAFLHWVLRVRAPRAADHSYRLGRVR